MKNEFIQSLFSLQGRVAIVTGGSRGIGNGIANAFARCGASVYAISRSASDSDSAADGIVHIAADITSETDMRRAVEIVSARESCVDALVNAAGISIPSPSAMQTQEAFEDTIGVNMSSAYRCIRHYLPLLEKSRGASVINVASIGGLVGFPDNPGYVASKGGLRLLTKALAVDLAKKRIRVNSLLPGYIITDMTLQSYRDEEKRALRSAHTLLGRWGEVDDLYGAAIFLASEASAYMTGTDLVIDGGWMANGLVTP